MKTYYQKNKIKSPKKGKRYIVGDIHGCYQTFKTLIEEKIKINQKDQLFLLGDYVNKGPESKKTLDYIMHLIKKGFRVYPLRGNHEQTLLDYDSKDYLKWLLLKSPELLKNERLRKKYRVFLNSLPFYYELDNFFLVHASFNFEIKNPFNDKTSILWSRKFDYNKNTLKNKTLIHGHQPEYIDEIIRKVQNKEKVIGLDNGVVYTKKHKIYDNSRMGNLCALNLDTYELFIQKNIEKTL